LLLKAIVLPANTADQEGARRLLANPDQRLAKLDVIWADEGFESSELAAWVERTVGARLAITGKVTAGYWLVPGEQAPAPTPQASSQRWVVERSFAWVGRCRRLTRDYEYLPESEEALCYLAMVHLVLKRLTK
jgi:transposase